MRFACEWTPIICGRCKRPKRDESTVLTWARREKRGFCDCGRRTEYKPEYVWMIKQRFEDRAVEIIYQEQYSYYQTKDGHVYWDVETGEVHWGLRSKNISPARTMVQFPTFQRRSTEIGILDKTRIGRTHKYPLFKEACEYCEQVMFAFWTERGATWQIVPQFAKMRGQKYFGFTDKVENNTRVELSFIEISRRSKERQMRRERKSE